MVHRDIKPANLLVQKLGHGTHAAVHGEYTVKILDFGLARIAATDANGASPDDSIMTGKNTVMGTPDFISPEQARGLNNADAKSDQYSLGCSLYFLLTGKSPFPGGASMEKLVKHSTAPRPDPRALRPDVPEAIVAVVHSMMAIDPYDRFASCAETASVLEQLLIGHDEQNWLAVTLEGTEGPIDLGVSGRLPAPVENDPFADLNVGSEHDATTVGAEATDVDDDDRPVRGKRKARYVKRRNVSERNSGGVGRNLMILFVGLIVLGGMGAAVFFMIQMAKK
jgi:serine/threonine protein kinase